MTERENWIKCGIGESYHEVSLLNFQGDKLAKAKVTEYISKLPQAKDNGLGIFAWGSNGNGKTSLMCIVLKEALKLTNPKTRCYFTVFKTSLSEVVTSMTKGWYDDNKRLDFERTVLNSDFLLIDDVEKAYMGKEATLQIAALDMVLRKRVERLRPVLMTSNERPEALVQIFGNSIGSLLSQAVIPVYFETKVDFRKENPAAKRWKEIMSE